MTALPLEVQICPHKVTTLLHQLEQAPQTDKDGMGWYGTEKQLHCAT